MRQVTIANMLGYDASILRQLSVAQREAITWLATGWLLSCGLLASPMVYVAWLISHALLLALGVGVASFALLLVLLRLLVAGGAGAAPRSAVQSAAGPTLLMGILAILFAQAAQLPLLRNELAAPVALRRAALLAQHQAAATALADRPTQARDSAIAYREQLAHCEFVVLRLQQVWSEPVRALRYTLLYFCLVLLPSLLARGSAQQALRRYQLLHAREHQACIERGAARAQASIGKLLAAYATYDAVSKLHAPRTTWLAARVVPVVRVVPESNS